MYTEAFSSTKPQLIYVFMSTKRALLSIRVLMKQIWNLSEHTIEFASEKKQMQTDRKMYHEMYSIMLHILSQILWQI